MQTQGLEVALGYLPSEAAAALEVPMDNAELQQHVAATKIQASYRGRAANRRFKIEVAKLHPREVSKDGCTYWDVILMKNEPSDRYGFSHSSGADEFARARGALPAPASASAGPDCLIVKQVAPEGILSCWNEDHPEAGVLPTDRIVEVNGATIIADMQRQLQEPVARIRVCRYPSTFALKLTKTDSQKFGVRFRDEAALAGSRLPRLHITEIDSVGLLEQHNISMINQGCFQHVVTQGMCIEAVNDVSGSANRLVEALLGNSSVHMRIWRGEAVGLAQCRARLKMRILAALRGETHQS
jgi:hypothetical protein